MTWRIGAVEALMDDQNNIVGAGFVLLDDDGRPCITFGFAERNDANINQQKISEIIKAASAIIRASQPEAEIKKLISANRGLP